jgi:hypothetical protein
MGRIPPRTSLGCGKNFYDLIPRLSQALLYCTARGGNAIETRHLIKGTHTVHVRSRTAAQKLDQWNGPDVALPVTSMFRRVCAQGVHGVCGTVAACGAHVADLNSPLPRSTVSCPK